MEPILHAAEAAGASTTSLQMRVNADAPSLATQAERTAYLMGMHAAFLVLSAPTHTVRPSPTPSPMPPSPTTPPTQRQLHSQIPTLGHLARQRASIGTVPSPGGAIEGAPEVPTSPDVELLGELLADPATPLSAQARFAPSRWLLLWAYEACHGSGCVLQQKRAGILQTPLRTRLTVDLFCRLIGMEPKLFEPRHALFTEAMAVHNRARCALNGLQDPPRGDSPRRAAASLPLRRWLSAPPVALSSKKVAVAGEAGMEAALNVRSPSPTSSAPGRRLGLSESVERDYRAGIRSLGPFPPRSSSAGRERTSNGVASPPGPVRGTPTGFSSSSVRQLQPTAGEEASQRDIWQAKGVA